MMNRISHAHVSKSGTLKVLFDDGDSVSIQLSSFINQGGHFDELKDDAFSGRVTIGERGRFIAWPNDLEMCADALSQHYNPET